MIGLQVKCNGCGRRCVTRQNLKNHKFLMMSQLQWYGKRCGTTHNLKTHKLSDDESIAMNGKRCRATHNLKIHKWLDDNLNAMNVEWIAGQGTIQKLENDQMTSQLQLMWKEMQDNAQFENLRMIRWQVICDECKKRSFEQF